MPTSGGAVRAVLTSRRGRSDARLYARAAAKKAEITEWYSVRQEISSNSSRDKGRHDGRIEVTVPFDGRDYFTRQAAEDVQRGSAAGGTASPGTAVIGHVLLADHGRTDLRNVLHDAMQQHGNVAVIPIEVPVGADRDALDELTADRQTCVIRSDYHPKEPDDPPIWLEVELHDPDLMQMQAVDLLARWGEIDLTKTIDTLRTRGRARFDSGLEMDIRVGLKIPVKRGYPDLEPSVKLASVSWPTITSLRTTMLTCDVPSDPASQTTTHAVRYNPVNRRLEWTGVRMHLGARPEGSPDLRIFESQRMRLKIGHPGELSTEQKLKLHVEVEIPRYLLSGLDARLFDATGNWQRQPASAGLGGRDHPWQPKLTTRLTVDTDFYVTDMFARRYFKPYQQYVFDDVTPSLARITDIVTELRKSRFYVQYKEDPRNQEDSDTSRWLLLATREEGSGSLDLLIAVEGETHEEGQEHIMGNDRTKKSRVTKSGSLRLSVLGTQRLEHANLAYEMNHLQHSLRDQFRSQQTTRR